MTWVIGRAGPFGYAVGISDIRVTLGNGEERDCLQKIYQIGPQLALGFAGSVAIGFEIVNHLSATFHSQEKNLTYDSKTVTENLIKDMRDIFSSSPDYEKALGCHLMLLFAHPINNDGDAPWAKCYLYRLYAPDFKPTVARSAEIVSIGSGNNVKSYIKALRRLENDLDMFKLEAMTPSGAAAGLLNSISSELNKRPAPGISNHLHICIVGRNGVMLGKNDIEGHIMPPVATSMKELHSLIHDASASSIEQAIC